MDDTIECPCCGAENVVPFDYYDGMKNNCFEMECHNCDRAFEVKVEYVPVFYPEAYAHDHHKVPWTHDWRCRSCGTWSRLVHYKGAPPDICCDRMDMAVVERPKRAVEEVDHGR